MFSVKLYSNIILIYLAHKYKMLNENDNFNVKYKINAEGLVKKAEKCIYALKIFIFQFGTAF